MANNTSQYILSTSANLLGFCLIVITSFHIADKAVASRVDEFTSVIAILLTFSCAFSFFAIRTKNEINEKRFERVADYLFLISLAGVLIIISLIALRYIK